ncbi:FecR family protein [Sunxiuqinia elliptica]
MKNLKAGHGFNGDFLALIKDENFIRLIKESDDPDRTVAELINKYPNNKSNLQYAAKFIQTALSDKRKMSFDTWKNMHNELQSYAKKVNKPKIRRLTRSSIWKAAALVAMIAIAGVTAYYQVRNYSQPKFIEGNLVDQDKALIILSDGSQRVLSENDTYIDYKSSDDAVVIKKEEEKLERFENVDQSKDIAFNQIIVPYGQRHKVRLSDGTVVLLNAGSKLVFPAKFSEKNREVTLDGQGFFEVEKDKTRPFIVKTSSIDIKVLGTVFDVSAYQDEDLATTILVEGKVEVSQKNRLVGNKEYILSPGQGCFYSAEMRESIVRQVNVHKYISWKDGVYQFENMTLLDLVRQVKKYYNKSIQIEGEELELVKMSGKLFLSDDFQDVMIFLSKTVEGSYEQKDENHYIIRK